MKLLYTNGYRYQGRGLAFGDRFVYTGTTVIGLGVRVRCTNLVGTVVYTRREMRSRNTRLLRGECCGTNKWGTMSRGLAELNVSGTQS